jgi:hypothetical protein
MMGSNQLPGQEELRLIAEGLKNATGAVTRHFSLRI